jgi:hypothetical protein
MADLLRDACAERGIQLDWIGGPGGTSSDARHEMLSADVVFAAGRAALEAMAAGRAVFVTDEAFTGGWLTPESYERLEADGFTGLQGEVGADAVTGALDQYSPALGADARRLAVRHHAAQHHAAALVEIYGSAVCRPVNRSAAQTVALLAGDRFQLEDRALRAEWRAAGLQRQLEGALGELDAERRRLLELLADARRQRDRARKRRDRLRQRLRQRAGDDVGPGDGRQPSVRKRGSS